MINQDDSSGRPIEINQLQWALRHGQKIDGLENMILSNQPVILSDNPINKSVDENSVCEKISVHNTVTKESIDQLRQSIHRESVAQATALEEQIVQLGQLFNQEILSVKSQIEVVAHGKAVEEQIEKLGQSLNQEISSLKEQTEIVVQSPNLEEEINKIGKCINQEILSLRNEFTTFVQAQLTQEKAWSIAALELKTSLKDRATELRADMQKMRDSILEKFHEGFEYVDEQLQTNGSVFRQEVSLLTSQLAEFQQFQNGEGEVLLIKWRKNMEERQNRLIEDIGYIQHVVEEIATRPHSSEAQQKLRENFFIREISALKEEMAGICRKYKSLERGCVLGDMQQCANIGTTQEVNLGSGDLTQVYHRKRKRRH